MRCPTCFGRSCGFGTHVQGGGVEGYADVGAETKGTYYRENYQQEAHLGGMGRKLEGGS